MFRSLELHCQTLALTISLLSSGLCLTLSSLSAVCRQHVCFHWDPAPYRLDPVTSLTRYSLLLKPPCFISCWTQRNWVNQPHFLFLHLCTPHTPAVCIKTMSKPVNRMSHLTYIIHFFRCCYVLLSMKRVATPVMETRTMQRIPYICVGEKHEEGPHTQSYAQWIIPSAVIQI